MEEIDINKLRKMKPKEMWAEFDHFTDKKPADQLRFWFEFYKPIVSSLFWAIFPALAVALMMKYGGKYSDFEIGIVTVLVFISVRVNNVYAALMKLNETMEKKNNEGDLQILRKTDDIEDTSVSEVLTGRMRNKNDKR